MTKSKSQKKQDEEKERERLAFQHAAEEKARLKNLKIERQEFLKTDEALNMGFSLQISLKSLRNLPDPWSEQTEDEKDNGKLKKKNNKKLPAKLDPKKKGGGVVNKKKEPLVTYNETQVYNNPNNLITLASPSITPWI